MIENKGEIVIYQTIDGQTAIDTRLEQDTVWLTQKQMVELFQTTKQNISLHIKNCFAEGELSPDSTVKEYLTVQQEGKRRIERQVEHYNLDVIISVGYRVKSLRGTQFRIWANRILKEHLVQGYTINQKRLKEQQNNILRLRESIQLVERSLQEQTETIEEARKIVKVLAKFASGLQILDDYDHETLEQCGKTEKQAVMIYKQDFLAVVEAMRRDFDSAVFGLPKDSSFDSSVGQIYQSFAGNELYPSIEHKAAMLLYLVVKNHSFVDGNKRIAAALFLYFLDRNGLLYNQSGHRIISDEGLAALTLLIAISKPEEKDTMVKIVITVLNRSGV